MQVFVSLQAKILNLFEVILEVNKDYLLQPTFNYKRDRLKKGFLSNC